MNYAGDISPKQAFEILTQEPGAVLVDVRTRAEWAFVGVPDLANVGKKTILLSWQNYPEMAIDADFAAKLKAQVTQPVRCCSSAAAAQGRGPAAIAATAAGYARCYNVSEGFEGDKDGASHRGQRGGWKVAGLPWVQD